MRGFTFTFTFTFIFLFSFVTSLSALSPDSKSTKYGSFVFNSEIPNALFFKNQIQTGDDLELRKALRNHKIDTIVLASPGGNVWTGLRMAGIIFDKKLKVFVPKNSTCASACSFMFFAGNERLSAGELGVHQFSSSNKAQTDETGKIQAQSQFTVSEIIGFLNEFDTPRFVFERMFENSEIYWFTLQEKQTLASDNFSLGAVPKEKMTDFMSDKLSKVVVSDTNRPDESKLPKFPNGDKARVVAFQRQFNLLGCDVGREDGKWGPSTETAFRYLSKMLSTPYSKNLLNEPKFFAKLTYQDQEVCANFTSYARYKAYWDAYLLGLEKCFDEAPHTTNIAMDHATCVWKYDEKAISKYSMGKIYHLAYQRYKAVFDLAKSSTVSYYSGAITADQHLKNTLEKTADLIGEHSKNIRQELGIFVPYGY